jgi:hypothetical protein
MRQKSALIIRHVPYEGVAAFRGPIEAAGYSVDRIDVTYLRPPCALQALERDLSPIFEATPFCEGAFYGERTKRFGGLLRRSRHIAPLVEYPIIVGIAHEILSPACDRIQLDTRKNSGGFGALMIHRAGSHWRRSAMDPKSLFSLNDHLEMLSRHGDPLEVLERTVDFEYFRVWLVEGLGYGDGSKGGRPPVDPVAMFKILIVQAQHNLSDARMEYMIRDRLSWMRVLGFALGDCTPDENTIRHVRRRYRGPGWSHLGNDVDGSGLDAARWRVIDQLQERRRPMTYVKGFVLAVPEEGKQVYIETAEKFWTLASEFGALSQVECWEADVKDGHTTDFRKATKAQEGEKIVFS